MLHCPVAQFFVQAEPVEQFASMPLLAVVDACPLDALEPPDPPRTAELLPPVCPEAVLLAADPPLAPTAIIPAEEPPIPLPGVAPPSSADSPPHADMARRMDGTSIPIAYLAM